MTTALLCIYCLAAGALLEAIVRTIIVTGFGRIEP